MQDTTPTRANTRAQVLTEAATPDRSARDSPRIASSLTPSQAPPPQVFYTYESAEGRLVIVDSLDQVPQDMRPRAERVAGRTTSSPGQDSWQRFNDLDLPSFGLGFGSALLAIGALTLLVRSRRILGALLGLGLAVALGAAYLGWLRRSTDPGSGGERAAFASPQQIIEDAKRAVDQAKLRQAEQEQTIERIQREAR